MEVREKINILVSPFVDREIKVSAALKTEPLSQGLFRY